jgi:hypothetical protein
LWQILLQKDLEHPSEQHWFKIRRHLATLIQESVRLDSIVAHFCSEAAPRRLLQQYRHGADMPAALTGVCSLTMSGPIADMDQTSEHR